MNNKQKIKKGGQWLLLPAAQHTIFSRETFTDEHRQIEKMVFDFAEDTILPQVKDIEELRYKESDRINSMERGLNKLGIKTESTQSSIKIHGGELLGGIVDSYGDHRVAMAFSVAALVSKKPITILNTENVSTSFPNFVDLLIEIGAEVYEL